MNVKSIDFKLFSALTGLHPRAWDRDDFAAADPFGVRVGVLTTKNVRIKQACLTIELQPRSSLNRVAHFFISLTPAFSNRTIWSMRHRPSYWRIDPADIPNFRRLQALMSLPDFDERFQEANLCAYTRRVRAPQATSRTTMTSLYLQLAPNRPFALLSRDAYQPSSLLFNATAWPQARAV
ncbi:hypothetical protein [Dyella subtropica]|uniref:hypothetical protein n=1 Tax=Dyella subtropica TaxID=2992127 RepID=UPI00224DF557|nr:hypothetical protein [Dyella subtropica]